MNITKYQKKLLFRPRVTLGEDHIFWPWFATILYCKFITLNKVESLPPSCICLEQSLPSLFNRTYLFQWDSFVQRWPCCPLSVKQASCYLTHKRFLGRTKPILWRLVWRNIRFLQGLLHSPVCWLHLIKIMHKIIDSFSQNVRSRVRNNATIYCNT